ncbi:hypothetical protein F5B19DRAFT_480868 [Rostrohypoxylon terebratum]|nr:hypothetical protein F5B19DRAFT_480868 [Rostrohypoxylon terebratum]
MAQSFTLSPNLPPELRRKIWLIAVSQSWGYTSFQYVRSGSDFGEYDIKAIGKLNLYIRRSCYEARSVTEHLYTHIQQPSPSKSRFCFSRLSGLFNVRRHLFFFHHPRDYQAILYDIVKDKTFADIQHVVIKPVTYVHIERYIRRVMFRYKSIRTLVVVFPWDDMDNDAERRRPLFKESPQELNIAQLLDDIETGIPSDNRNTAWQDYEKVQRALEKCRYGKPLFLMRTRAELTYPTGPPMPLPGESENLDDPVILDA